jgi:hypothetical protein
MPWPPPMQSRDDTAFQSVALHRMPGREHGSGGADRMSVRDCATFHIDDFLRQVQFAVHGDCNGGECLIDFDSLDICHFPLCAPQCLLDRGNRAKPEHSGLYRSDAVGDETCHRRETVFFRPVSTRNDHCRRATVEAWGIAGSDCAIPAECGTKLGETRSRCFRAVVLVCLKKARLVSPLQLDGCNFISESARSLCGAEALLRTGGPGILIVARNMQ